MKRCLDLAQNGLGRVAPNPMVGCAVVKDGRIIGEGFHHAFGGPHAEVNAINSVTDQDDLKNSTLYVSLEPCSHYGKTPPCADLIIRSGIPRVVLAQTDPNPEVAGKGINKLREAGIKVTTGVLENEANELNRRFRTFHEKKRPYVILKWAMTSDGYMDTVRSEGDKGIFWISSAETKKPVHQWRAEEGAILVGRKTVENDDPSLDTRHYHGSDPLRVILIGKDDISTDRKVFKDGKPTLVIGKQLEKVGGSVDFANDEKDNLIETVLSSLYDRGINSVMVEGGAFTLQRFIESRNWDEARVIRSKNTLSGGLAAPVIPGRHDRSYSYGRDQIYVYRRS